MIFLLTKSKIIKNNIKKYLIIFFYKKLKKIYKIGIKTD
jgi:hypothetical protein